MMLPSKVKIGAIYFDVKEIQGLTAEEDSKKIDGHIVYNKCEIRIEASLNEQVKRVTLWHEIIHGILTFANVEHDERIVDVLGYGIVAALDENTTLLLWQGAHG
jgi:hypothetical protein